MEIIEALLVEPTIAAIELGPGEAALKLSRVLGIES